MTEKEEKRKAIAVDYKTHQQAKVNAALEGKPIKEYIAELVEADTAKK